MEKRPPGIRLNRSGWGKLLLAAGLLLVSAQGLLQLYDVQEFFFPGRYYAVKLNLINVECSKIDKGLISLQVQLDNLAQLQKQQAQRYLILARPSLADPSSLPSAVGPRNPESSWPVMIHAAKKKRVYVARKLRYIDAILRSMQPALESQLSENGSRPSARKVALEKTLQQIQKVRDLWLTYNDDFQNLSEKLEKLEEYGRSPQTRTIGKINAN
jgi:hypothetical protein